MSEPLRERATRLRPAHAALALLVVAIWGTNFVVIKVGLRAFEPLFFATLRFFLCAVPLVFILMRPPVPWRWLALFGILLGPGQFALLFYAMRADISPGLASLLIQVQVFFTIGLSVWLFGERLKAVTIAGIVLGASGLATIALHLDATVTPTGIAIVVLAAFCWACANIVVKRAVKSAGEPVDMLAFVVWSSLFAVPPLLALVLVFEGGAASWNAIANARWDAWAALVWQAVGNTLFGYVAWNWLIARYDAAVVTPYALLIPVFGMGSSALMLGEPLPPWKWLAAALVIGGIALITLAGRRPKSA
ncbi:MAG: EamA family transporter [Usitatibacter sp.]